MTVAHRLGTLALVVALAGSSPFTQPAQLTVADVLGQPAPTAGRREAYGDAPLQFGELRVPSAPGPHPVAIVIHGGCWRNRYGLELMAPMSAALTAKGLATWNVEYRRVGDEGGGWPGTFLDVAAAADHLRELAARFPLDLTRVVAVGHSAGGHLALWLAARPRLPEAGELHRPAPLRLSGVVSLAGVPDLADGLARGVCDRTIADLVGGTPDGLPGRYAEASPRALLPLGIPQYLITGREDRIVPPALQDEYAEAARKAGDRVTLTALEAAGHFEPVVPTADAWTTVERSVLELAGGSPAARPPGIE